jgi:hypothetical protein
MQMADFFGFRVREPEQEKLWIGRNVVCREDVLKAELDYLKSPDSWSKRALVITFDNNDRPTSVNTGPMAALVLVKVRLNVKLGDISMSRLRLRRCRTCSIISLFLNNFISVWYSKGIEFFWTLFKVSFVLHE